MNLAYGISLTDGLNIIFFIIVGLVFKRLDEHVHSPGRVLGDRRVLYKYLNPNLMAVLTRSPSYSKPAVNVFLINSATGKRSFRDTTIEGMRWEDYNRAWLYFIE